MTSNTTCSITEAAKASKSPCTWCDYSFICCHETGIGERALEAPAKPFEPEKPKEDGTEEPT
mgnify:CR=1 FL=1